MREPCDVKAVRKVLNHDKDEGVPTFKYRSGKGAAGGSVGLGGGGYDRVEGGRTVKTCM